MKEQKTMTLERIYATEMAIRERLARLSYPMGITFRALSKIVQIRAKLIREYNGKTEKK